MLRKPAGARKVVNNCFLLPPDPESQSLDWLLGFCCHGGRKEGRKERLIVDVSNLICIFSGCYLTFPGREGFGLGREA